jgi:hypothetical protein
MLLGAEIVNSDGHIPDHVYEQLARMGAQVIKIREPLGRHQYDRLTATCDIRHWLVRAADEDPNPVQLDAVIRSLLECGVPENQIDVIPANEPNNHHGPDGWKDYRILLDSLIPVQQRYAETRWFTAPLIEHNTMKPRLWRAEMAESQLRVDGHAQHRYAQGQLDPGTWYSPQFGAPQVLRYPAIVAEWNESENTSWDQERLDRMHGSWLDMASEMLGIDYAVFFAIWAPDPQWQQRGFVPRPGIDDWFLDELSKFPRGDVALFGDVYVVMER